MDAAGWAALGTWVAAAIYVVILVYAVKQVGEAKRLRRAQTRPFVVVDIAPGYALYITVENVGSTLARNVTFEFPVPLRAAVEEPWEAVEAPLFKDGLKALPPGKRYRVFFDAFVTRVTSNQKLPMSYEVVVRYEDDDGNPYRDPYTLDLNSFMHTSPEEKGLPELVAELEAVRKTLDGWTDGVRGLLVHARDKDQMIVSDRERWEERQRERAARGAATAQTAPPEEPGTQ